MNSANQNRTSDKRFAYLLAALENGQLTPDEEQELNEILRRDELARQVYLDHVELQALLVARLSHPLAADSIEPLGKSPCAGKQQTALTRIYCFFAQPTPLSMTVAALVMVALVTTMAFMAPPFYRAIAGNGSGSSDAVRYQFVGQLTGLHRAEWAVGQVGTHRGANLVHGHRMELKRGVVEITFKSGARVFLEGPAVFELDSNNGGRLEGGKLTAVVPKRARGFEIHSSAARVVDLGTEFGIEVSNNGEVDVIVLDGEVECYGLIGGDVSAKAVRLRRGEAAHVSAGGESVVKQETVEEQRIAAHQQLARTIEAAAAVLRVNIDDAAGPIEGRLPSGYRSYTGNDGGGRTLQLSSPLAADGKVGVAVDSPYFRNTNDSSYGDVTVLDRFGNPLAGYNAVMNSGALVNEKNHGPIRVTLSGLAAGEYRIRFYLHGIFPRKQPSNAQGSWRISGASSASAARATFGFNSPSGPAQGVPPTDLAGIGQVDLAFRVSNDGDAATFQFTPNQLAANGQLWVNGFELHIDSDPTAKAPANEEETAQP